MPLLNLVPPVLIQLVKSPLTSNYDLSHVTEVISGAGALGPEVFKDLMGRFSKDAKRRQGRPKLIPV